MKRSILAAGCIVSLTLVMSVTAAQPPEPGSNSGFVLRSPDVVEGGTLPTEYTGDGAAATLPLQWSGAPDETRSFAVIMHHVDPDNVAKWYWVLYDIPANTSGLPKNVTGIGTLGSNSVDRRVGYAPPHSKGPGTKKYTYTIYALSDSPQVTVPPSEVTRDVLLSAMENSILASAELNVLYTREGAAEQGNRRPRPRGASEQPRGPQQGGQRRGPEPRDQQRGSAPPLSLVMRVLDANGDGELSADEMANVSVALLKLDTNGDGTISREEQRPGSGREDGPRGQRRDARPDDGRGMADRTDQFPGSSPGRPNQMELASGSTHRDPSPGGQTVGLFNNSPEAFPGYTLFAPKHHTLIYLMDNQGRAVHSWKSEYEPGQSVYLLENGHLLHCCFTKNKGFTSGGEGGRLEEFDWDGNLVWEFEYSNDEHLSHHDIKPLPNGNILMLAVEKKSLEECIKAGFDPRMMRDNQLFPEFFIEVQRTGPKTGKIVWEWHVWDHLIQDNDPTKANYGDVAAHPELVDVDCNGRGIPAFWNHGNSIAYNAKLDQIVLSARGCNEIWVVDHSTTTEEAAGHTGGKSGKGGDLLYRWGNPAAYGRGTTEDRQLFQQHDAQWIPDGCPGAGHILIFNNGMDRGYSTVVEIVPPMDERGNYIIAPGKAFGPDRPTWTYQADNPTDFYSSEISGAHRLPNGNTLICAGVIGKFFEVTPAGETVWEYVNPVVRRGILAQGEWPGLDHRGHSWNAVFKIHRYPVDYPALAGKDLTPTGPIEQSASLAGKTGFANQSAHGEPVERAGPDGDRRPDERRGGGQGARARNDRRPGVGRGSDDSRGPGENRPMDDRPGGPRGQGQYDRGRPPRQTSPDRPATRDAGAPNVRIEEITGDLQFGEGPAADAQGNVFFSDIRASITYRWSIDGQLSVVRRETGGANGLYFDRDGNLIACEGERGRLVSIDAKGRVTVLADEFGGKRFNKPNDLWIDPKGGVYFSDPAYGTQPIQDGEHVYYLTPDRESVVRVISDMVRPNGLVGTADGENLYVTDHGSKKTYCYRINDDGSLSDKRLFAPIGADGMTIDRQGNVYLCEQAVLVYSAQGQRIDEIRLPESPTNACFGGDDGGTLFVTTRAAFYAVPGRVERGQQ